MMSLKDGRIDGAVTGPSHRPQSAANDEADDPDGGCHRSLRTGSISPFRLTRRRDSLSRQDGFRH